MAKRLRSPSACPHWTEKKVVSSPGSIAFSKWIGTLSLAWLRAYCLTFTWEGPSPRSSHLFSVGELPEARPVPGSSVSPSPEILVLLRVTCNSVRRLSYEPRANPPKEMVASEVGSQRHRMPCSVLHVWPLWLTLWFVIRTEYLMTGIRVSKVGDFEPSVRNSITNQQNCASKHGGSVVALLDVVSATHLGGGGY